MEENSNAREIKIVLVGESSVGKTCIVDRATKNVFEEKACSTLGASFSTINGDIDGEEVVYQMWDTAGQEKYRGMAPMYFRGAHAALCVFSVNDRDSFDAIDHWVSSIHGRDTKLVIFVVANKIDLEKERKVTREEGLHKAKKNGASYLEISAKTGEGFEAFLLTIGKEYLAKENQKEKPEQMAVDTPKDKEEPRPISKLGLEKEESSDPSEKKHCCC